MQHGDRIAPEVGTRHGDDMGLVAGHELPHMIAQLIVWVSGDVVKLVYGNQALIKGFNPKLVYCKAKGVAKGSGELDYNDSTCHTGNTKRC